MIMSDNRNSKDWPCLVLLRIVTNSLCTSHVILCGFNKSNWHGDITKVLCETILLQKYALAAHWGFDQSLS